MTNAKKISTQISLCVLRKPIRVDIFCRCTKVRFHRAWSISKGQRMSIKSRRQAHIVQLEDKWDHPESKSNMTDTQGFVFLVSLAVDLVLSSDKMNRWSSVFGKKKCTHVFSTGSLCHVCRQIYKITIYKCCYC